MKGENNPAQELVNAMRAGEFHKVVGLQKMIFDDFRKSLSDNFTLVNKDKAHITEGYPGLDADQAGAWLAQMFSQTDINQEDLSCLSYAMGIQGIRSAESYDFQTMYSALDILLTYNKIRNDDETVGVFAGDGKRVEIKDELNVLLEEAKNLKKNEQSERSDGFLQMKEFLKLRGESGLEATDLAHSSVQESSIEEKGAFYQRNKESIDSSTVKLKEMQSNYLLESEFEARFIRHNGRKEQAEDKSDYDARLNTYIEEQFNEALLRNDLKILATKYINELGKLPDKDGRNERWIAVGKILEAASSDTNSLEEVNNVIKSQLTAISQNKPSFSEFGFIRTLQKIFTKISKAIKDTDSLVSNINSLKLTQEVASSGKDSKDENFSSPSPRM